MKESAGNSTYEYIIKKINSEGALHFSLLDPDPIKQSPSKAAKMAYYASEAGTDAFLLGGSTIFDQGYVDKTIEAIKTKVEEPIIIFPGGIANVSEKADAIFFMSLLNSSDPYFIIGQQALASYIIKLANLEHISMGYLIIEPGASAGWIGNARLMPRKKPKLTAAYSLAAEMFGFKMIYLEAGSGSEKIPPEIIKLCSKIVSIPIIAGGGVNSKEDAKLFVDAGADIIVMGTFIEQNVLKDKGASLKVIIDEIKEVGGKKKKNFSL
ncbi:MAG: geranylgeranylglyceryl/heptaprenylglyceryl phosphate synthase [Candidatus Lokiarchaeota archaeon]|nr:geranylgeranylglyceryl/heptaprenylglyceryl phosphate synthase [Candidatus Lokiarchaeota archaeon]MBD3340753.1 geranylgeranylglyceryl/heptaprenylglyceryl phosphate synthase [Candidatus Lokiarchaeota archaeon]